MSKPSVYFRADGNSSIGLGHISRCLALYDMLKEDCEGRFVIHSPSSEIVKLITNSGCKVIQIESPNSNDELEELDNALDDNSIVVIDGYHFDNKYFKTLKNKGHKIVFIDDLHHGYLEADIIINHAEGVTKEDYHVSKGCSLLLGAQYSLLKNEFREATKSHGLSDSKALFICFGGADPNNVVLTVLKNEMKNLAHFGCIHIVLGSAYQHHDELQEFIGSVDGEVKVHSNLDASQMRELMSSCAYAITSPSTISYEYLCTGGKLFLKPTADNQQNLYKGLLDAGVAFDYEQHFPGENLNWDKTFELQNKMFDGEQDRRFRRWFKFLQLGARSATIQDCQLYFDWANDPATREQSYNSEPIPWENHVGWYNRKIENKDSYLYLITLNNKPIGQIRYDLLPEGYVLSYSIDSEFRGLGFGTGILLKGAIELKKELGENIVVVGYVKNDNFASVKAFRNAGYKEFVAENLDASYKFVLE